MTIQGSRRGQRLSPANGGLSEEQQKFLDRWSYDEESDTDTLDSSFGTKPSTVYMGKPFGLSNAVQAVGYTLADGRKALGLVNRYNENGTMSNPRFFALAAQDDLEVNTEETTVLTGNIDVSYTAAGDNLTSDFLFKPSSAGRLLFEMWLSNDDTGAKIFSIPRTVTQAEVNSGAPISFTVGNHYLLDSETEVFGRFSGIDLLGSATIPYFVSQIHAFKEVQINGHVEHVNSAQTLYIGCHYNANTTGGRVSLTVPLTFRDSFSVGDAAENFSVANPCVIDFTADGQGLAVLQTVNDLYQFAHDGTDWVRTNLKTGVTKRV